MEVKALIKDPENLMVGAWVIAACVFSVTLVVAVFF